MPRLITLFCLFCLSEVCTGQSFLRKYKEHKLAGLDTLPDSKSKRQFTRFVKSQILELDTVFRSYKAKTGFDFNHADTLFMIYDYTPESPFSAHVIVWSGADTISYQQGYRQTKPFTYKRTITYRPYLSKVNTPNGFKITTERDSLLRLVANRDYSTINHLGDNQSINDGSYVKIYVAYKNNTDYKIETCFPKQFFIPTAYKRL